MTHAIRFYPARLKPRGFDPPTDGSEFEQLLEKAIPLRVHFSRAVGAVACYPSNGSTVIVDAGLAQVASKRGFSRLVGDVARHAQLYQQGAGESSVWDQCADYYSNTPDEFFELMDCLGGSISNEGAWCEEFDVGNEQKPYYLAIGRRTPCCSRSLRAPAMFQDPIRNHWYLSSHDCRRVEKVFERAANDLAAVKRSGSEIKLSVVVTIYRESKRLAVDGEDSLRIKIRQLEEIRQLTGDAIQWELLFVPERGDPDCSGQIVRDLMRQWYGEQPQVQRRVQVLPDIGPEDARQMGAHPSLRPSKGNGILAGFRHVIRQPPTGGVHLVAFTDLDTSVDLRLFGLLIKPFVIESTTARRLVVIGSRVPECHGIAVPDVPLTLEGRIGRVTVAIRNRFLLPSLGVRDTQVGFKVFARELLAEILPSAADPTFAFDTELLLLATRAGASIIQAPVFWSDSESATATTDPSFRLDMLLGWTEQSRRLINHPPAAVELLDKLFARVARIRVDSEIKQLSAIQEVFDWLTEQQANFSCRL